MTPVVRRLLQVDEALQIEEGVGEVGPDPVVGEDQMLPSLPLADDGGEERLGAGRFVGGGLPAQGP